MEMYVQFAINPGELTFFFFKKLTMPVTVAGANLNAAI